jgi:1-acyl-sn-glycerol-3-phosphate acyltransferase
MRRTISVLYTIPVCIVVTGILIGLSLAQLPFDRSGAGTAAIFRFWARSILAVCRVRVRYHGLERVNPERRYICVCNHASLIDIPALMAYFPLRLCYIAKEELFHIPVMGAYLRRMRHIPVVRGDSRAAARSMQEAARSIAAGDRSVLVFPEGTRSRNGLGEFKEGAALLAIRSGVPLLPVAIAGGREIWPSKSVVIRPGTVDIHIGCETPAAGLPSQARGPLTADVRAQIAEMLGEQ